MTEKEVIQLSAEKYAWYIDKKFDLVENLYHDSLVFIHITGHHSHKNAWITQMRLGSFVYNKITIKEATAKVYGSTAVLVGKAVFIVNGGSIYNLIYTEVYTKKLDEWKLVNIHTCTC
jgi:Domain of unknown function (DUF4440)